MSSNQNQNTQQQSGSGSATASGSAAASSSASRVDIPATAQVGGVTVTNPPQTATSYYKIAQGEMITFGWNFTSLYVTPTHLTVSAVCDNGNTFPVGPTDGVIDGTATQVVWDIGSYISHNPATPLVPTSYTLMIWDDRGKDATARAGYMAPNSALEFAMYTPQAYTPLSSGWSCTGCNRAVSSTYISPVFVSVVVTMLVMLLSGFSVLRAMRRT